MYILSISHGKDSLKTLDVIKETEQPLDAVITVDIWADNNTRGELPQVLDFKKYCDKEIEKRYGIKVEHIRGVSFKVLNLNTI